VRGGTTVSTSTVRRVAGELERHGRVRRGWLGIGAQGARLSAEDAEIAGQATGVLVGSVAEGSPAAAAGVRVGDLLLSLDGVPLTGVEALWSALSGDRVEAEVPIVLLRGGQRVERAVRPTARPEPEARRCG
jgi:S1-C subfamily serine protease